jgi:hypothetical protein
MFLMVSHIRRYMGWKHTIDPQINMINNPFVSEIVSLRQSNINCWTSHGLKNTISTLMVYSVNIYTFVHGGKQNLDFTSKTKCYIGLAYSMPCYHL